MQLRESQQAAEKLANEHDIPNDDHELDTLRADETFAAWAYIYDQADLYERDLRTTAAGETMTAKAEQAAVNARAVALCRAEELLERRLTTSDTTEGK